jgi:hypothetical protein
MQNLVVEGPLQLIDANTCFLSINRLYRSGVGMATKGTQSKRRKHVVDEALNSLPEPLPDQIIVKVIEPRYICATLLSSLFSLHYLHSRPSFSSFYFYFVCVIAEAIHSKQ